MFVHYEVDFDWSTILVKLHVLCKVGKSAQSDDGVTVLDEVSNTN